jgi:hypothetical protein
VDRKTLDHLQLAERNRDIARKLIDDPTTVEWAAIAMFYSAVHYVNAYLWERYHKAPRDHGERTWGVHQDAGINACLSNYDLLKDVAYHARYTETYTLSEQDARALLEVDLRAVEFTILTALGRPIPTW